MLADANISMLLDWLQAGADACTGRGYATRRQSLRRLLAEDLTPNSHVLAVGAFITPARTAVFEVLKWFVSGAGVLHPGGMVDAISSRSEGSLKVLDDEAPATEDETRLHLLTRSNRDAMPLSKSFIQNPDRSKEERSGPLAEFIRNGDLRGLRALLFLHAIISNGDGENGWSTTLPLSVWARVFDTTKTATDRSSSTSATKILTRLVTRRLVERSRSGRKRNITVTLLRPDGSGNPYIRPDGKTDKFISLSHKFWTEGWHEKLDLAATAMLLVALHEKPSFELVTERMPAWYGWSADTAERGLKTLRDEGLLQVHKRIKKAPLSPTGAAEVNIYTLIGALAPKSTTSSQKPTSGNLAKKSTTRRVSHTGGPLNKERAHRQGAPVPPRKPVTSAVFKRSTKGGLS